MNIDEIFNTPRKKVDVENIELPETMEVTPENDKANDNATGENNKDNSTVTMSCGQLANMAIGVYNAIQTAVYKRIEPEFDATLTPEETNALLPPTTAVLEQYNVTVSPLTALVVTLVGINVGKIMQIKMLQAEKAKQQVEKAVDPVRYEETTTAGSLQQPTTKANEPKPAKKTDTKTKK